jgi:hypothetical protein
MGQFLIWEIIPRGCFNTFSRTLKRICQKVKSIFTNKKTVHLLSTTILYTIKVLNVVFDLSSS